MRKEKDTVIYVRGYVGKSFPSIEGRRRRRRRRMPVKDNNGREERTNVVPRTEGEKIGRRTRI